MSNADRAPPPDATLFTFPPATRLLVIICLLGFTAFGILSVLVGWKDARHGPWLGVIVFGTAALLTINILRRLWDKIGVNSQGIWYLPRRGEPKFIAWTDVGTLKANDVGQRIIISDKGGTTTIKIEYQIGNFAKLREIVLSNTPISIRRAAAQISIFHRSKINKIIFVDMFVVSAILTYRAMYRSHFAAAFMFMGFSALSLVLIALDPSKLEITRRTVVLTYPVWKRTFELQDITSVELANTSRQGNVWAAVILKVRSGQPVKLFRFREGSLALHDALKAAVNSSEANAG